MGSLQPTQICTILVQASGFDELAGEVRKGNYNIDATAITERLSKAKSPLFLPSQRIENEIASS